MARSNKCILAGFLCIITCANQSWSQSDLETKRLHAEAPPKWAEFEKFAASIQGKYVETRVDLLANRKLLRTVLVQEEFGPHGERSILIQRLDGGTMGQCYARNPDYAFALQRKVNSGPWVLAQLDLNVSKGTKIMYVNQDDASSRQWYGPFSVYSEYLPLWIKHPDFKFVSALTRKDGLFEFSFRFDRSDNSSKQMSYFPQRGKVILDPSQYWRVREYDVDIKYVVGELSKVSDLIVCEPNEQGFPILKSRRSTERATPPDRPEVHHESNWEFEFSATPSPASHFYLSHFGLPEPRGFTPPASGGSRLYLWLAGGGLAVIAIGLFVKRAKRPLHAQP